MIKRFLEWIRLKEKLHNIETKPPLVSERDVWWISFGDNVGSEINGKSDLFSRPGIILKKLSRDLYLVAPTTSKEKEGSWYAPIYHNSRMTYVCLHQIKTIDSRRLSSKLFRLDQDNFLKVKRAFWALYK